ncbi:MAG: hypothetical protein U9N47_00030 [Thermodesulfobacteriota bacterium]|nr:hypothetical protein [Thermodesulfobacteriota bacterium]
MHENKSGFIDPDGLPRPTKIEFINAMANYYNHNEEWINWPNNPTVRTMQGFNIDKSTDYPLSKALEIITINKMDCTILCDILTLWREYLVSKNIH